MDNSHQACVVVDTAAELSAGSTLNTPQQPAEKDATLVPASQGNGGLKDDAHFPRLVPGEAALSSDSQA